MRVRGVVIAAFRLVGKAEAAVVERDHAEPGGRDGCNVLAPGVHRGSQAVQQNDRDPLACVDVTDARAIAVDLMCDECRPGWEASLRGNRGCAAGRSGEDAEEDSPHSMPRSAARARAA